VSWVAICAAGVPGPVTRNGARDAARRELSKAIYHRNDQPWTVRLFNAVQRWLGHLLDAASRHAPGGGAGALGLVLAVIALVVLVWWRVGLIRGTASVTGPVLDARRHTSADLLRTAVAAADDGRWDAAVVARMRALAMAVEERELVDPRPGRTADELAAEVAAALPTTGDAMRHAAGAFDAVAYGGREATRQTYDTVVAAAELVDGSRHRSRWLQGVATP
jgi:hypothetical protein